MKKKFKGFVVFLFAVGCVAVCVLLAELLSSVITVGSVDVGATSSSFNEHKLYAISLGNYSTETLAEEASSNAKKRNAGGYIWKKNEQYYVFASAYEKENDAKAVVQSLSDAGITSEVVTLDFDGVTFKDLSSAAVEKNFLNTLSSFKNAFIDLYDISVSVDTEVIDETKAKIQVISVKSDIEKALEETTKGTSAIDGIYYQMIRNKLKEGIDILDELKDYEAVTVSFSAKIKYTYIELLKIEQDLIELINNDI